MKHVYQLKCSPMKSQLIQTNFFLFLQQWSHFKYDQYLNEFLWDDNFRLANVIHANVKPEIIFINRIQGNNQNCYEMKTTTIIIIAKNNKKKTKYLYSFKKFCFYNIFISNFLFNFHVKCMNWRCPIQIR